MITPSWCAVAYSRSADVTIHEIFGADKVVCSDVLDIDPLNPLATIVGDLGVVGALPEDAFDCIVLTQTLQLIYNLDNAMENLYRALAPGGALLITVPGISPIGRNWISIWYWAFTELSLKTLLGDRFGESNVQVQSHGNVFAAICFLTGLSLAEVETEKLDLVDEGYPVTVFACARKPTVENREELFLGSASAHRRSKGVAWAAILWYCEWGWSVCPTIVEGPLGAYSWSQQRVLVVI